MNSRDRQFWTEFLLLYRSLPAVWKVKSAEYSSRAMKSAGYKQLVVKLREVEPLADRAMVVKKINSFRTNFRRDLRKRRERQGLGQDTFESTLWYFDLLGFLERQECSGSLERPQKPCSPDQKSQRRAFNRRKPSKVELPSTPFVCTLPPAPLQHSLCESEALCRTWRSQFDELAPRQKLLARKLISDVLYYGCMDQLQARHVAQLQQLMPQPYLTPSPHIEDESTSPQAIDNYDDDSDTLDENG